METRTWPALYLGGVVSLPALPARVGGQAADMLPGRENTEALPSRGQKVSERLASRAWASRFCCFTSCLSFVKLPSRYFPSVITVTGPLINVLLCSLSVGNVGVYPAWQAERCRRPGAGSQVWGSKVPRREQHAQFTITLLCLRQSARRIHW